VVVCDRMRGDGNVRDGRCGNDGGHVGRIALDAQATGLGRAARPGLKHQTTNNNQQPSKIFGTVSGFRSSAKRTQSTPQEINTNIKICKNPRNAWLSRAIRAASLLTAACAPPPAIAGPLLLFLRRLRVAVAPCDPSSASSYSLPIRSSIASVSARRECAPLPPRPRSSEGSGGSSAQPSRAKPGSDGCRYLVI
jgi:hypothetical protein